MTEAVVCIPPAVCGFTAGMYRKEKAERKEKHETYEKMVVNSLVRVHGAGAGGMSFIRDRRYIRTEEDRTDFPRPVRDPPGASGAFGI